MGLDMYAYTCPKNETPDHDNCEELFYWRKFNALHGWMEGLWRDRGGEGSFNCVKIKLEKDDLLKLISDTLANRLVPVEGFFFGQQEIWPEDLESVFLFVGKANLAIQQGKDVYYDSWW